MPEQVLLQRYDVASAARRKTINNAIVPKRFCCKTTFRVHCFTTSHFTPLRLSVVCRHRSLLGTRKWRRSSWSRWYGWSGRPCPAMNRSGRSPLPSPRSKAARTLQLWSQTVRAGATKTRCGTRFHHMFRSRSCRLNQHRKSRFCSNQCYSACSLSGRKLVHRPNLGWFFRS